MSNRRIIGYHFEGSYYCPDHIAAALPTGPGETFDGWGLLVPAAAEENLDEIAAAYGIERDADSNEFPVRSFEGDKRARECRYCALLRKSGRGQRPAAG